MTSKKQQPAQLAQTASQVFYSVFILLILGIIGYFVKLGFNIFLARHLSVALYGDFILGMRILAIASSFVLLGTDSSAKRFVSRFLRDKKHDEIHIYLSWNMRLVGVTSLICSVLVVLSFLVILALHLTNMLIIQKLHVIVYLLWITPLAAIAALFGAFFSCNRNYNLSYFLSNFAKYIFVVGFAIVGIYYLDLSLNGMELAAMMLLSLIIMLIIELIGFKLYLPQSWRYSLKNSLKKKTGHDPEWLKASTNLITNNVLFLLLSTLDLIIIETITPNEAAVGHYAAVLAVSAIIWVIPVSVNSYITPNISYFIEKKQFQLLQSYINMSNYISYTVLILFVVLMNVFAQMIFHWFGKMFSEQVGITLIILSVGTTIASMTSICPRLLAFSGHESVLKWLTAGEIVLMIIFGFPLTYFYGIEGTATSVSIVVVLKGVIQLVMVRRSFPLKPCIIV